VADADDRGKEARVRLAGECSERAFRTACQEQIVWRDVTMWDEQKEMIRAIEQECYGALILNERPRSQVKREALVSAWQSLFQRRGLAILEWGKQANQWIERMQMIRRHRPDDLFPDCSEQALIDSIDEWLGDGLARCRSLADLRKLDVHTGLRTLLTYSQTRMLDEWAPTHWQVPSGSRIPIDYADPDAPILAVRLQELFGLSDTPTVAGGRLTLVIHLLSPAHRPVQVTRDLMSFWRNTYPEVRKDLRGRYPKHVWPDNPLEAAPTARAKPKGSHS
jgi:ATP-dependent helicase HrpB